MADLIFAHDWNLRQFRAVTRTVTFVLHRPPDGWNSAALKRLITQAVARAKRKSHDQPLTQPQIARLNVRIVEVALRTLSLEVVTEPL